MRISRLVRKQRLSAQNLKMPIDWEAYFDTLPFEGRDSIRYVDAILQQARPFKYWLVYGIVVDDMGVYFVSFNIFGWLFFLYGDDRISFSVGRIDKWLFLKWYLSCGGIRFSWKLFNKMGKNL